MSSMAKNSAVPVALQSSNVGMAVNVAVFDTRRGARAFSMGSVVTIGVGGCAVAFVTRKIVPPQIAMRIVIPTRDSANTRIQPD